MLDPTEEAKISVRSLVIGTFFAGFFAFVTAYFENRVRLYLTSTQIAVMPYILLFVTVLLLNPVCRVLRMALGGENGPFRWLARRLREMRTVEVLIIFIMGSVSSGISTFGLVSQLIPLSGSYFNQHWNNDQSKWDQYVTPFISESYFVSEPGIQAAALEYRTALMDLSAYQRPFEQAIRVQRARDEVAEAKTALAAIPGGEAITPAPASASTGAGAAVATGAATVPELSPELVAAQKRVAVAEQTASAAAAEWLVIGQGRTLPPVEQVITEYPAEIKSREGVRDAKKSTLDTLEQVAFERVETFRRGLPAEMRSFPGAIMVKGESFAMYKGRVRRFLKGIDARRHVEKVQAATAAGDPMSVEELREAVAALTPVSDLTSLGAERDLLNAEWEANNQKVLTNAATLKDRRAERDIAQASDFSRLDTEIASLQAENASLARAKVALDQQKENLDSQITSTQRVGVAIDELNTLIAASPAPAPADAAARLDTLLKTFPAFDASWRRFLVGEVPWSVWSRPLFNWAVLIGLTYTALMAFNVLIYRQWAHNERLIYPLAELPELLVGAAGSGANTGTTGERPWFPAVYRSGLFWVGFSISAIVMGWNVLVSTQWVPGLEPFDLANKWNTYIANTALAGLAPSANAHIFFTLIGLAFLIPSKISFSMWFYYVLYMVQLLVLVWFGFGINEASFPVEWYYTLNFRYAEGGGALIVFATVILWKCRKYLLAVFMPKALAELERPERTELRIASGLFLAASLGCILLVSFGMGANIWWTMFSFFIILIITIGLVRAVTEGGILGFQAWVSPFHLIRSIFGMDKAWTAPQLFLPIFFYYAIMFLDIKTFIAPAMANSIKIRDDLKMKRLRFHVAICLGIVAAVAVAVVVHLMMAYDGGADRMNSWFYTSFPQSHYAKAAAIIQAPPIDAEGTWKWLLAGAVVMGALLILRQSFFWLPHPIGLIMLVSPIMAKYWFSIFIGWMFKYFVTKYGNKNTYDNFRTCFVGLIMGELFIIAVSTILGFILEKNLGVDLNR